jgi:hypothetical protein
MFQYKKALSNALTIFVPMVIGTGVAIIFTIIFKGDLLYTAGAAYFSSLLVGFVSLTKYRGSSALLRHLFHSIISTGFCAFLVMGAITTILYTYHGSTDLRANDLSFYTNNSWYDSPWQYLLVSSGFFAVLCGYSVVELKVQQAYNKAKQV